MSNPSRIGIRVERADGDRWDDLCRLFGRAGASNGCWCQYWILGPGYNRRDRSLNKDALARECAHGGATTPGLIAYTDDGRAVGWARLSPRSQLGWLNERFVGRLPVDDDLCSLSCFYVPQSGMRRRCDDRINRRGDESSSPRRRYAGGLPGGSCCRQGNPQSLHRSARGPFLRAGFTEVQRLSPDRAVVRFMA